MKKFILLAALLASTPAFALSVTRGPYLQLPGEGQMTVVWKTDTASDAVVHYGTSPDQLTGEARDAGNGTTHVVSITGLTAGTKYWYSVGSSTQPLGSGPDYFFRTHPKAGEPRPFRFFAWGDSGDNSAIQKTVSTTMDAQVWRPDFALILGDIVYPAGEPQNYDPNFFTPYKSTLRNTVIWPAIGNHDVLTSNGQAYFDNYYLPTNNPKKIENYYSFDYANAHFVALDSQNGTANPAFLADMLTWLEADLAASKATFKIVYFHHPPYSGGTHPDDAIVKSKIVPVLEKYGVDLVLSGHSHVYERTYLLKNNAILQNDKSNYQKLDTPDGTLYIVTGAGGESGPLTNPNHPMMAIQKGNVAGNTIIDVEGNTIHGLYLLNSGTSIDLFRLTKDGDKEPPRIAAFKQVSPTSLQVVFSEPVASGANAGSAELASSYSITPAVPVQSAKLGSDGRTVTLTTAAHADGAYTLTAAGIDDMAATPNHLATASVAYAFGSAVPPPVVQPPAAAPTVADATPAPGSTLDAPPAAISVHVKDAAGILANAIAMTVNGQPVTPEISGTANDRLVSYAGPLAPGEVKVAVVATNQIGVPMAPFEWSFNITAAGQVQPSPGSPFEPPAQVTPTPGQPADGTPAPAETPAGTPAKSGCNAAPGALMPGAMLALAALFRRRRRA